MILIDDRIGSADLVGHLRHWHIPCEMTRLPFADAAFAGNGPTGPITVGVEVKRVKDALQCMRDGRFAGVQLPGLVQTYERIWMVLEGKYTVDFSTGLLLIDGGGGRRQVLKLGNSEFMFRDLDNWITTMEVCAGLRCRRTLDRVETARFLADLYGWFQKDYDDHQSHKAIHEVRADAMLFRRAGVPRMVAAQLPGVGFKKSEDVVKKFNTVNAMTEASPREWATIPGIGMTMATRIYDALHNK